LTTPSAPPPLLCEEGNITPPQLRSNALNIPNSRLIDKRCKQRLRERIVPPASLGMPLHTEQETPCCIFDRLDDAIGCKSPRPKIAARRLDRLMVITVDLNIGASCEPRDETAFRNPERMSRRRLAIVGFMRDRGVD